MMVVELRGIVVDADADEEVDAAFNADKDGSLVMVVNLLLETLLSWDVWKKGPRCCWRCKFRRGVVDTMFLVVPVRAASSGR